MAPILLNELVGPSSGKRAVRVDSTIWRQPKREKTGGDVRVAVTGGAGYIGSTAVARLVARADDVVVIDNLVNGHEQAVPDGVPLAQIDICDPSAVVNVLRQFRPDAVLHFAALTIAPESVRDPAPYWRVNTGGTLNVLDAMRDAGVTAIVFSSTAAVYGNPEQIPIPEDAPLEPINPYGASKLAAERAVASYAEAYGFAYAALRYFNVAGASGKIGEDHRPETHLIPSALDAAAGWREPLSVYGTDFPTADGTAIRDYVHVEDLIDAHLLALDNIVARGNSLGSINLGTRGGASVREVLDAVERVTGVPVPTLYSGRRPGDPAILVADASKENQVLGWQPKRSNLDEMVSSAWAWRQRFPAGYEMAGTRKAS
ncbi:MAG TPA: UDP-glucose 4-epimerase GalE [Thermomicrobiales bacterium]|nr:UDP-glucose 4-epimerase GalE [Thermomicrobiales bacterium]